LHFVHDGLVRAVLALVFGCLLTSCGLEDGAPNTIFLQPLGRVSASDVATARRGIEAMFNARVTVRPGLALPQSAYYAPRKRYRAEALIAFMAGRADGRRVIGLTSADVSTTKGNVKDWGVLGLGSGPARACVVSTFRMGRTSVVANVYRARVVNVCNHELGHTYGLPHCPNPGCIMADAKGHIRTFDDSVGDFCAACRAKLGGRLRSVKRSRGNSASSTRLGFIFSLFVHELRS
jgi:archaemetzincin